MLYCLIARYFMRSNNNNFEFNSVFSFFPYIFLSSLSLTITSIRLRAAGKTRFEAAQFDGSNYKLQYKSVKRKLVNISMFIKYFSIIVVAFVKYFNRLPIHSMNRMESMQPNYSILNGVT